MCEPLALHGTVLYHECDNPFLFHKWGTPGSHIGMNGNIYFFIKWGSPGLCRGQSFYMTGSIAFFFHKCGSPWLCMGESFS